MVTLQKERARLALPAVECATGNARNLLVADDGLAVERDGHVTSQQRDVVSLPFAPRLPCILGRVNKPIQPS